MATMHANGRLIRLNCIALFLLFLASFASAASAQTSPDGAQNLAATLTPEMTVWITDSEGREEKTRILGISGDVLTTAAGDDVRRFRTADVMRVRTRHSDSLWNGALIGAGAAVASGLFVCSSMEPWENCRDDVGPMVRIGAVGAGIGIAIDALIRGRKTIYEAPGSTRLSAGPIVSRRGGGLQLSLSF
jgi:hypothetical protein